MSPTSLGCHEPKANKFTSVPRRVPHTCGAGSKGGQLSVCLLSLVRADPGIPNYRVPDCTLNKFAQTRLTI